MLEEYRGDSAMVSLFQAKLEDSIYFSLLIICIEYTNLVITKVIQQANLSF